MDSVTCDQESDGKSVTWEQERDVVTKWLESDIEGQESIVVLKYTSCQGRLPNTLCTSVNSQHHVLAPALHKM
jgi:hypothetical protein